MPSWAAPEPQPAPTGLTATTAGSDPEESATDRDTVIPVHDALVESTTRATRRDKARCVLRAASDVDILEVRGGRVAALVMATNPLADAQRFARAEPWRGDLIADLSVPYDKGGDTILDLGGRSSDSLPSYEDALAVAERLARVEPFRVDLQQNVSLLLLEIADGLRKRVDCGGALAMYQEALAIAERIAHAEPFHTDLQRHLSLCYERVGELLSECGNSDGARAMFQKAVPIMERLAQGEPSRDDLQQDLSVWYNRIGGFLADDGDSDGALVLFRKDLEHSSRRAGAHPARADLQADLAFSYRTVGRVLLDRGDSDGALAMFRSDLAITERLAQAEPSSVRRQADLSVSYQQMSNLLVERGAARAALAVLQKQLTVVGRLVRLEPSGSYRRDLARLHERVGDARVRLGDIRRGRAAYGTALRIRQGLGLTSASSTGDIGWLLLLLGRFQEAEHRLAVLVPSPPEATTCEPCLRNLAHARLLLGRTGEALPLYRALRDQWPAAHSRRRVLDDLATFRRHRFSTVGFDLVEEALREASAPALEAPK